MTESEVREPGAENIRRGATIRALREAYGLTPQQLAKLIGISRSHLVNIEFGVRRATPPLCHMIAAKLNIPLAAITVENYEEIRERS